MGIIDIYMVMKSGSRALGPGLRYVVWVQGCPFCCPRCATPQARAIGIGEKVTSHELAIDISSRNEIEGVTISGGEPMAQAGGLAEMLEELRNTRPSLTTIVYTGYKIEDLKTADQQRLLRTTDVLIDGQYVHELNDGRGLRGSSNQRIHMLTDRLMGYREEIEHGKRRIEAVLQGNRAHVIGILNNR